MLSMPTRSAAQAARSAAAAAPATPVEYSATRKRKRSQTDDASVAPPAVEPQCSICLELLVDDDYGTTTCGHSFHAACLARWMIIDRKHSCPECRAHVGASASRSRLFSNKDTQQQPRQSDERKWPRFHGG